MQRSQDEIFATFEGDKWFERNKAALERFDAESDFPIRLIELYRLRPRSVLEVGAANGFRLAAIYERYKARVIGIEPSAKAIRDGRRRFPNVELVRGTASSIPLNELFDLIIVNFVLHWVDRSNLLRSLAEIDRLLADRGFVIIGDFLPSQLTKVRYHHVTYEELYTYKQNYAAVFLACGLYREVCLITADHSSKALTADVGESNRIGFWLLQKVATDLYGEHPSR